MTEREKKWDTAKRGELRGEEMEGRQEGAECDQRVEIAVTLAFLFLSFSLRLISRLLLAMLKIKQIS